MSAHSANKHLSHNPAISLLEIYTREMKTKCPFPVIG